MASILFDASLDTVSLDASIDKSNEKIQKWVADAIAAVSKIDTAIANVKGFDEISKKLEGKPIIMSVQPVVQESSLEKVKEDLLEIDESEVVIPVTPIVTDTGKDAIKDELMELDPSVAIEPKIDQDQIQGEVMGMVTTIKDGMLEVPELNIKIDVSEFDAEMAESFEKVLEFVTKTEFEYQKLSLIPGKISTETKRAIAEQEQYVNKLQQQIDVLTQVLNTQDLTTNMSEYFKGQIDELNKIANEEATKLIEMKDSAVKGNSEVAKSEGGVSNAVKELLGPLAKYATLLGALALAKKVFVDVMESSVAVSERYHAVLAGLKGAYDGFLVSLREGDMGDVVDNMWKATKVAKEYKEVLQEYSYIKKSEKANDINEQADLQNLISLARSHNYTLAERQKFYQDYVKTAAENGQQESENALKTLNKLIDINNQREELKEEWIKTNFGQLSEKQVTMSMTLPEGAEENIKKFREEWRILDDLMAGKNANATTKLMGQERIDKLRISMEEFLPYGASFNDMMLIAAMREELNADALGSMLDVANDLIGKDAAMKTIGSRFSMLANSLGLNFQEGSIGKMKQELADLTKEFDEATTNAARKTKAAEIELKKKQIKEAEAALIDKKEEARKLKQEIAEAKKDLEIALVPPDKADTEIQKVRLTTEKELQILKAKYAQDMKMADQNGQDKVLLTKKYEIEQQKILQDGLDKEKGIYKNFLDSISELQKQYTARAILDMALTREDNNKNKNAITVANKPSKLGFSTADTLPYEDMNKIRASNKLVLDHNERLRQIRMAMAKDLMTEEEKRIEILAIVNDTAVALARQLGTQEEITRGIETMAGVFNALAQGNYLQAALIVINTLIQELPIGANDFSTVLDKINRQLEEQARLIELSSREGGGTQARQEYIKTLKQELELLKRRQVAEQMSPGAYNYAFGFKWRTNASKERLKELEDQLTQAKRDIEDAEQELADFMTGGLTSNMIADVIAQGFADGKTSVDDFADYMNNVLWDAMLNVFKQDILGDEIKKIANYYKESMATGDETPGFLSPEEKAAGDKMVAALAEDSKAWWDSVMGALANPNSDLGAKKGLSGAIQRSITEETGTELAGLMRKISDDNRQNRDYNSAAVTHLVMIEANTFQTVEELKTAVIHLQAISINTGKVFSGI